MYYIIHCFINFQLYSSVLSKLVQINFHQIYFISFERGKKMLWDTNFYIMYYRVKNIV